MAWDRTPEGEAGAPRMAWGCDPGGGEASDTRCIHVWKVVRSWRPRRRMPGIRSVHPIGARASKRLAPAHTVKELRIVLCLLYLVDQEFSSFEVIHRIEQLAQYPDFLQHVLLEQQFFLARTGAIHVDGWIRSLL